MAITAADSTEKASRPIAVSDEHPVLAWLRRYQKPIAIGAGIVVVIALVVWFTVESGQRKKTQAMEALDRARAYIEMGNYAEASSALQGIVSVYGGTDAALEAHLALNQVRLLSGQAQLAADELRKFAASNPPGEYRSAAHFNLAIALENTGKFADAAAEYLRAAEFAAKDYGKVEALLNAARAYQAAGKVNEAETTLRDVLKKYPNERIGVSEAEVRLAELTKGKM